jgi:hypothetical protein
MAVIAAMVYFFIRREAAGGRVVRAALGSGQRDPTHGRACGGGGAGYPAECDRGDGGDRHHRAACRTDTGKVRCWGMNRHGCNAARCQSLTHTGSRTRFIQN